MQRKGAKVVRQNANKCIARKIAKCNLSICNQFSRSHHHVLNPCRGILHWRSPPRPARGLADWNANARFPSTAPAGQPGPAVTRVVMASIAQSISRSCEFRSREPVDPSWPAREGLFIRPTQRILHVAAPPSVRSSVSSRGTQRSGVLMRSHWRCRPMRACRWFRVALAGTCESAARMSSIFFSVEAN